MARVILFLAAFGFAFSSNAKTNYERFIKLFEKADTVKMRVLLQDWEKSDADDPEFYTSAFNFYYHTSKRSLISLQSKPQGGETFEIVDSRGNTAGYLGPETSYHIARLDSGFMYIDKGIQRFPDRLDMRFGKCYALKECKRYDLFVEEVGKVIDHSLVNKNNWLWTKNEKDGRGEEFMLSSVFDYQKQLYETEDDSLIVYIQQIGDKALAHYPKNIEIISITAVAYLLTDNFDKAITYFKKAEQIDPEDFIVLNNMARTYRLMGDRANALKYYELTAKYGDEEAKEQAIANINELKRQQ